MKSTQRKTTSVGNGKPRVRPLAPSDWPVIEQLFGPNGACGGCWCMAWRVPRGGKLWEESKGKKNRRAFRQLVTTGKVFGALAFVGEQPVGWCCVGPRRDFPRIERIKALALIATPQAWSVTCFFIKSPWRRKGVASALLAEAVRVARQNGAKSIEAYPIKPYTESVPAAFAWTGVPALFERERFVDVTPPGHPRPIYRRALRGSRSAR